MEPHTTKRLTSIEDRKVTQRPSTSSSVGQNCFIISYLTFPYLTLRNEFEIELFGKKQLCNAVQFSNAICQRFHQAISTKRVR